MNFPTATLTIFLVISQGSNIVVPLPPADIKAIATAGFEVSAAKQKLSVLQAMGASLTLIQEAEYRLALRQREYEDLAYRTIQELRPKRLPQPECEGIRAWFSPDGKFHEELRHDPKGYLGRLEGNSAIYEKGFLDCHSE
jgi:hypothetical protein